MRKWRITTFFSCKSIRSRIHQNESIKDGGRAKGAAIHQTYTCVYAMEKKGVNVGMSCMEVSDIVAYTWDIMDIQELFRYNSLGILQSPIK